jgi:multiple sugar transport system permease protein
MPRPPRPPRGRRDVLLGLAWISPWIIGTIVFLAIPVAMSIHFSLTDYSLLDRPVFIGLSNYTEIAHDAVFWRALRNTAVYALSCLLLGTILSILIAALLEQRLRAAGLVRAIVFLPTLIPVVSASIGWMWLYNGQYGLLNSALARLSGGRGVGVDWLGDPRWAMPSLILMGLWVIGSAVVILTAAMRDVPEVLYEAAELDGMSPLSRFRHVTLPMISPAIVFNAVMSVIWGLQVFAVPLIMTKGGPDNATIVYSMYIYSNAFEYGRMGYASALAWIQFLIAIVLTIVALVAARRFVHYRGN